MRILGIGLSLLFVVVCGKQTAAELTYRVTDLGHLSSVGNDAFAFDINNDGAVVGWSGYNVGPSEAFVWTKPGGMVGLGWLTDGLRNSVAEAVSGNGYIAGSAQVALGTHAFLWTVDHGIQDLGTLGGANSYAHGVNSFGHVVGQGYDASQRPRAVVWTTPNDIRALAPSSDGLFPHDAYSINDRGEVVGYGFVGFGEHAFIWTSANGTHDLGDLQSGFGQSKARALNEAGEVVGDASIFDPNTGFGSQAFIWSIDLGMRALGDLDGGENFSRAYGVNDHGRVVGFSDTATGFHAFVASDTEEMQDLNDLLHESGNGWVLIGATAINNAGQIVGWGLNPDGVPRGFLLTPVPEPRTLTMMIVAVVFFFAALVGHKASAFSRVSDC